MPGLWSAPACLINDLQPHGAAQALAERSSVAGVQISGMRQKLCAPCFVEQEINVMLSQLERLRCCTWICTLRYLL